MIKQHAKIIVLGTLAEPIPSKFYGGIEEIAYFVIENLIRRGWYVYLIDIDDSRREFKKILKMIKSGRLKLIRVPSIVEGNPKSLILIFRGLIGLHKALKILLYDRGVHLINIFYYYPLLPITFLIKLLSKVVNKKVYVIYTTAAHYPWLAKDVKLKSKILFAFRKLVKNNADKIITLSKEMVASISYYLKIPINKFEIIHDCYDDEEYDHANPVFDEMHKIAKAFRSKADLNNSFIILYLARLEPSKGVDHLIQAIRILKERNQTILGNLKVIIAGKADSNKLFRYKHMVKSLRLNNTIHIIGSVSRSMVKFLYALSDLYVLPTQLEAGPPISLLQAVGSGIPAVTTKYALIPELFSIKYAVVNEPISEELANILEILIQNRKLLTNLWQEEYDIIKRSYGKSYCGQKYENICIKLLKSE